jgi:hypothetical protein
METLTPIALSALAWTHDHIFPALGDPIFFAIVSSGFALFCLGALLSILRKLKALKSEIGGDLARLLEETRSPISDEKLSSIITSLSALREEMWRLVPSEDLLSELRLELRRFRTEVQRLLPNEEQLMRIRTDLKRLRHEMTLK